MRILPGLKHSLALEVVDRQPIERVSPDDEAIATEQFGDRIHFHTQGGKAAVAAFARSGVDGERGVVRAPRRRIRYGWEWGRPP